MTDQPNDPQTPETPEPDAAVPPSKDERNMAMIAHLLGIVLCIIGPLIIWVIKKDESKFVDDQGKEAMNFQIVILIGYVVAFALTPVCIGFLILPIVWLLAVIFGILAGMKANEGVYYRYPFALRLIK